MFTEWHASTVEFYGKWSYDDATKEVGAYDLMTGYNNVYEDALTSDELGSYSYDAEVIKNDYYTLKLIKMSGGQYNGENRVVAEFELINSSGSKYLLGEAWKAEAGWEPGRNWFQDGAKKTLTASFTSRASDNITGEISFDIWGWNWDGSRGTQLFKDTVTITLNFTETDPVISVR